MRDHAEGPARGDTTGWWALAVTAPTAVAVLGALLVLQIPALVGADRAVLAAVLEVQGPTLTGAATMITAVGTPQTLVPLVLILAVIIGWLRRSGLASLVLVLTLPASELAAEAVKAVVAHPRPPVALEVGSAVSDWSFPSGHTTSGTAVLGLAAVLLARGSVGGAARRGWLGAGIAVSVLVGASRVYLGYHWPTDVVGGWLLGSCLVGIGVLVIDRAPAAVQFPLSTVVARWSHADHRSITGHPTSGQTLESRHGRRLRPDGGRRTPPPPPPRSTRGSAPHPEARSVELRRSGAF